MRKSLFAVAALAAGIRLALAAAPAALNIVVFDAGQPVPGTQVLVDGQPQAVTDGYGGARVVLAPGSRELVLRGDGRELLRLDLVLSEGEVAELIASLRPNAPAHVQYESSQAGLVVQAVDPAAPQPAQPPGLLTGRVTSSEGGAPVAGARVFIAGTPLDVRTDAEGRYQVELPPGEYAISVIAAQFDSRTLDGVAIVGGETAGRDVELTPAGLELPEFVVLEPYVEGSLASLVEERRDSASVADFLGAEQISRAGDSDAAGALKRVTGLTLVDGKYIYVRGLGERYSSVLLNGAQIPSPDPTRRVVPLDLFPTDVIESVLVQKTYSAEMPGEFGGGTISLRTRNAPEGLVAKLSATTGWAQGSTGATGLSYPGGSRDWSGYDSGARSPQGALAEALASGRRISTQGNNFTPAQLAPIGIALAEGSAYTPVEKRLEPKYGFSGSLGNGWDLGPVRLGVLASLRYDNSWDLSEEERATYTGRDVTLNDRFDVATTIQNIELSGFLNVGARIGEDHALRANWLLARVTEDEVQVQDGISDSQELTRYKLEWTENQLRSTQLGGEHRFPFLGGLGAQWTWTRSQARRDEPNRRTYAYQRNAQGQQALNTGSSQLVQSFATLIDDADGLDLALDYPLSLLGDRLTLTPSAGFSRFKRERDNTLRSFSFVNYQTLPPGTVLLPLEAILSAQNLAVGGVRINEATQPTENYTASQDVDARFLSIDGQWRERYRLAAGVRRERDELELVPAPIGTGSAQPVGNGETRNLPFAIATWKYSDAQQLRLGFSRTLSRPDFRELSSSPFTDPQLDLLFFGNPDLRTTRIENLDLRWEHYFTPAENLSFSLFRKQFTDPIEKSQRPGGSGAQGALINAPAATLDGAEVDIYRQLGFLEEQRWFRGLSDRLSWLRLDRVNWDNVYVSGNYARIRSTVELEFPTECGGPPDGGFLTSCERPLQGQSPYAGNLQLGYLNPDSGREYSLLLNRFGARIAQVGVDGAPDIYEQPVNQLDAVFQQNFMDNWSLKLRLRNLLDPQVRFDQGGSATRSYRRGREILLTLEWKP